MEYFRTKGELTEPGKCVMLQKELHNVHSSHNIIRIRPRSAFHIEYGCSLNTYEYYFVQCSNLDIRLLNLYSFIHNI